MKKRYKNVFRKPYIIFLCILFAVIVSVWMYLWFGLSAYEAGIPRNLMAQMVEDISTCAENGSCENIVVKYNTPITVGSYENKSTALMNLVKDKTLTYNKMSGEKGENTLTYSILADGEEIARARLAPKEKKGILGLALYEVSELSGAKVLTILAPAGATVTVKGSELNALEVKNTGIVPKELKKLYAYPQNIIEIPTYDEYFINGLFEMPNVGEIEVTLSDGTSAESVFVQENSVIAGKPASKELVQTITERVTLITKKYSYYMSDDLGWTGFRGYLVKTSPVYDRLRTLEVYWYTLHDSTRFENMVIDDFFVFSDELISLRLKYDYVVVGQGKVTTYDTDLTYFLAIDTDGKWRVAEMIVN